MVLRLATLSTFFLLISLSCTPATTTPEPPNIVWIMLEDTGALLGAYGTTIIETPHIDALAEAGARFTHAFMPAPVCSPSRSSIVTGSMSTTLGLHNHHSSRTDASAIYLPEGYQTIPELFRAAGYFTFNNGKDDYNFHYNRRDLYDQDHARHPLYGKRGERIPVDALKDKQPFFGQFQLAGGKEIFSSSFKASIETPVDRDLINLPPYLPDHPVVVEEYANHLDAIQITDRKVGELMDQLKHNNLLENTVVFFFSDHGMRMTRNKQFLYDGGLHVPLIVADLWPAGATQAGTIDSRLISGLDLGTSALGLAGITIPDYMEGLNVFAAGFEGREHVISTRDRCDFTIDRIRSVRSKQFKYIRNFLTDRSYTQPTYMDVDGVPFVEVMHQLYAENKLNPAQARFMSDERPAEELYDLENDPFELNNLAGDPEYQETRAAYAAVLANWMEETDDKGQYPENAEGLKLMLGIWGDHAINPAYEQLRQAYPDLSSSQFYLKSEGWQSVAD